MKSLDTFGHQRQGVVESNGDDDCELPKSFFWCKNFPPNKKTNNNIRNGHGIRVVRTLEQELLKNKKLESS